ncbi:hypothetical protein [Pseudoclavibacter soli]|uniref:hypothetical protein n=1 Tax=Pseudoclavibacter soli TaxID=452623 RepID=UPI0004229804|nr:hypothetical protein [Pseudoclavibacter soli]
MSAINTILLAAESHHESTLPIPAWGFALIAAGFFLLLGFIVFSFRDVYNRHHDEVIPANPALESIEHGGKGEH